MSFLKEESEGLLKKHWNLILEKRFKDTLLLVSRCITEPQMANLKLTVYSVVLWC
jgi:hypothetical protein